MKKFTRIIWSLAFFVALSLPSQSFAQCSVAAESAGTLTPSCSNGTFTVGAGAYKPVAVTNGVKYDFTWTNTGSCGNTNNICVNGVAGQQLGYNPGVTGNINVGSYRSSTTWVNCSSTVTYKISSPTTATVSPSGAVGICGLTSASLGGSTPTIGNGTWAKVSGPGTATFSNGTSPSSTVTVSAYGAYTFSWTINNGGCTSSVTTGVYTFYQSPGTAAVPASQDVCGLTSAALGGNTPAAGTATWSKISGPGTIAFSNGTVGSSTATASAYGTYVLRWTFNGNGSCASSYDEITVNYYQNPGTAAVPASQDVCGLTSAALGGNTPAAGTATWSKISGPGTIAFSNGTVGSSTATASAYGTYVLRWTFNGNGSCASSYDEITVNYYQNPGTASVGATQYKCGTLVSSALGGNAIATGTATWTKTSGPGTVTFSAVNSGSSTATVSAYGTYVLRWTFPANGTCAGSYAEITVNYTEAASVGATQYRCGTLVSAALGGNTPTLGSGAWTVQTKPGGSSATNNTTYFSSLSSGSAIFTADVYGTYVLRWTVTNLSGGCSTFADITVNYTEQATVGTSPQNVACNSLTSLGLGGNTPTIGSGAWSLVSGPGVVNLWSPNNTTANATANVSTYGTYTFRWTVTSPSAGCNTYADITVVYTQQNSISGNTSLCDDPISGTYSYTSTAGSVWTLSPGGSGTITSPGATVSFDPLDVTGTAASVVVTIRATINTCYADLPVTVYNKPTITSPNGGAVCESTVVPLTADVDNAGISWTVQQGPNSGGSISGYNFTAPSPSPSNSAIYVIRALTGAGCYSDVSFNVDKGLSLGGFSGPPTPVCDNTTLSGLTSSPAAYWSVVNGTGTGTLTNTGVLATSNTFTPGNVATPTQNATATIHIESANGACIYDKLVRIDNTNSLSTPTTPVCESGSVVTAAVIGDVNGVTWGVSMGSGLSGSAATANGSNNKNADVTYGAVTTGTATGNLTVSATNGVCPAASQVIVVDNTPTVSGFVTSPMPVCDNSTLSPSADFSVSWSLPGGGGSLSPSTGTSTTFTPTALSNATVNLPGVIVRATNDQCVVNSTVRVDNNPVIVTPASPACDINNPDFDISDIGETNVVWSTSHGTITNTGTRGVLTYDVPGATPNQIVTVTATNGSCAPTTTIQLDNSPALPDAGPDQTYYPNVRCGIKTATMAAASPSIPGTATWTQVDGPAASSTTYVPNNHAYNANITASAFGTYVYQWQVVNGSCAAAGDSVTIIYDLPLTRTAVEDDCTSMSEVTTSTAGNFNYSYFIVTAAGGTGPGTYTFPADDLPYLRNAGTVDSVTAIYEMEVASNYNLTINDGVGCPAGNDIIAPSIHYSAPIDIAHSAWINGSSTALSTGDCYDNGIDRWVTFCDNSGGGTNDAIMALNAHDNNLGLVTVSMYRNDDEPIVYNSSWDSYACPGVAMRPMERHFAVTTSNLPNNGQPNGPGLWNGASTVGVRLFFTNQELKDLVAETYGVSGSSNFGNGCLASDDVPDISKLYVTKYTAPPGNLATENGDYTDNIPSAGPSANPNAIYRLFGDGVTLPGNGPLRKDKFTDNTAINFDGIYGRTTPTDTAGVPQPHHFVEMDVTEFSEFWLHGSQHIEALPVSMLYLEANVMNNAYIQIKWAT